MLASKTRLIVVLTSLLCTCAAASARDSIEQQAADTVEVFIYGKTSKNEALLREISDPNVFEAMAEQRADNNDPLNENVKVHAVDITEIDGDRAIATATYSKKHTKTKQQADVHLIRVDGKWQITTPPKPATE